MQESANADLLNLIATLGLSSVVDVTPRPPVTLSLRGDTAVLSTPDVRELFESVHYSTVTLNKPMLALATAPAEDLRRINGRVFLGSVFHVRVTCRAAQTPADVDDPYFRRLVELRFLASELQRGFETGRAEIEPAQSPKGHPLFLKPLPLVFDAGRMAPLLADRARALSSINGFLFPPVRDDCRGTYFGPELRRARSVLAAHLGAPQPTASQPSALSVWRMLDDPFLRDLLLDGGSVSVANTDGEPTTPCINVWGEASADSLADYRARMLLGQYRLGDAVAAAMGPALARDLADTAPFAPAARTAQSAVNWSTSTRPRPFDAGSVRESGSWQRLRDLSETLQRNREHAGALAPLDDCVLNPSRPRPGTHPDHDLAEVELIRHLWRCPWSDRSDPGWRMALLDLLKQEFAGEFPALDDRVRAWSTGGHFETRASRAATEVLYPASASLEDVLRWRLTAPMGVIFKPNAQLRLDDRFSKLDHGFQLV